MIRQKSMMTRQECMMMCLKETPIGLRDCVIDLNFLHDFLNRHAYVMRENVENVRDFVKDMSYAQF